MKKTEKLIVFISIVLISLIAIGAVSAADDTAAADDADMATFEEVQAVDSNQIDDDVSYKSDDIVVTSTGDSGDGDVAAVDNAKQPILGANALTAGEANFTELNNDITSAQNGIVMLSKDYKYDSSDSAYQNGIDLTGSLTIIGGGHTIDGDHAARIFNIAQGANIVFVNLKLTNAANSAIYNEGTAILSGTDITSSAADKGGAIYNTATGTLDASNCKFNDNTAVYRGGAIYSEGSVKVTDSIIDSNDVTYRAKNDDNGGAAIYNKEGTLELDNVQVTNNLKNIVIRDGNAGDLIDAAIFTSGDATITNSVISKNSGSWGGGIYATNGATLTVKDSTFEENLATFGAAIYDEGAILIVDNCIFNDNTCVGTGSPGTSNTQAGAILVMADGASATITNSKFNRNKATTGGAVSVSQATGDVLIDNCEFTENTASYEGGAIYNFAADGATLTVKDSTFTDNTADVWGDAISNDAALKLEGNTITGGDDAAIGNWLGTIDSHVTVTILDGQAHTIYDPHYALTANVTDDQGNVINDHNFVFKVGDDEVDGTYYTSLGLYKADYTFTEPGTYTITTDYADATITTSDVTFIASLASLQALIDAAITEGKTSLDLTYGFKYEEGDSLDGIIVSSDFTINGNDLVIDGADTARLFKVTNGATLTLDKVVVANGKADDGAGVFVDLGAKLDATDTTFKDNTATYSGGAIYTVGGQISLNNCVLDGNDVTDVTTNNDTGGAAIYAKNAQVALVNTNVVNNGRSELDRTNDDLVDAVVTLLDTSATITGGLFESNTGIYGGAILASGDGTQTLTVTGATFKNNKAYNGGAIDISDVVATIDGCTFTDNTVVGPGSQGYFAAGGAIAADGNSSFTLTDSTFTGNSATGEGGDGGAVHVGIGGDGVATISGNTFTDNTAENMGNAIYNHGPLTLSGNTVTGDGAGIETVSKITTQGWVIVNDNTTIDVEYYDTIPIVVKITDDNGNLIKINATNLEIDLGDKWTRQNLTLDEETGLYTGNYLVDSKSGLLTPSRLTLMEYLSGYTANNNLKSTYINMIKADATLEVSYENVSYPSDVVITVNLAGKEGAPDISWAATAATPFKLTVNDVEYKVKITNGVGSLTISDLPAGTYDIIASWDGNTKYNAIETQTHVLVVGPKVGTFTDLANQIANAENGIFDLPYDFAYDADYDSALITGIEIDKTITINGNNHEIDGMDLARVFYVTETGDFTLKDTTITNAKASAGAAIYNKGTTTVIDSTFTNNKATSNGGAIYNLDGDVTVSGVNTFTNNEAVDGGAIYNLKYYEDSSKLNIEGSNVFTENEASNAGGAIYVYTGFAEEPGLTITGTNAFNENEATYGGAIFVNGKSSITGENTFTGNKATGTVDDYDAGGAIYADYGALTIDGAKFKENEGPIGGALYTNIVDLKLSNAEFTDNTAEYGGAIYIEDASENEGAQTGFEASVSNSVFSDNTATEGNAIYTDGALSLSGNTVSTTGADIVSDQGTIKTKVVSTILGNETYDWHIAEFLINATLTDDNGNLINDYDFKFIITYTAFRGNIEVQAAFDEDLGYYQGKFTPDKAGEYLINLGYEDEEVATSVISVHKSLTDLANIIAAAEAGAEITLDDDYAYIEAFDSALVNGIVIDKDITIKGAEDADTISGSDAARLFKVTNGATLTLEDVTICDGKADDGAGIYLESGTTLVATGSTFEDNTATYSGGAIYATGATISLDDCTLDSNMVTDFTKNNDTGGAAIHAEGSTLTIKDSKVTNNGDSTLDRSNGDLVNGAINLMNSDATITGTEFTSNTGIYGGAITTQAPAGEKTILIDDCTFTSNAAYTGGAVYVGDNVKFTISDSTFDSNNKATGEGTPGYTSGGGSIQIWHAGEGTIDNVTIKNSIATQGGAIGIETTSPVTIKDSTFTDNTATSEGGAIYSYKNSDLTVTGCTFTDNDAPFGSAISNDGKLSLSGNTITGGSVVPIANYYGTIESPVYVTTLDGQNVFTATATNDVTAVLKDDNGNAIIDKKLVLIVNNEEVTTSYNKVTGIMTGSYTFTEPGTYEVTAKDIDADHTVAGKLVYTAGTFTELARLIDAAEAGATITLDHDITYNEAFDGDVFKEGIAIVRDVTIVGADGIEICGNDLARVFKVANGATLTLEDVTICDGKADDGAGIYLESGTTLVATGSTFEDNTATYSGGAIYATGATISLDDCTLDSNMVTDFTKNNDTGGAAIHAEGSTLTIKDSKVTNNGDSTLDRSNGDLVNGAINLMNSDATITGTEFTSNTGIYGGAITTQAPAGEKTILIDDCTFTSNAAYTGGAVYVGDNVKFTISDSTFDSNNKATGEGTPGYTSGGGSIQIWHAGEGTIDNVEIKNSIATQGGAIGIEGSAPVTIKDSTFTDNTAISEGGAIYAYNDADLTITGSTFSGNTAPWGNAISNDGKLTLSGNTLSTTSADVGNWFGTIDSKVISTILENTTYNWHTAEFLINATLTDDNGNLINDHFFKFIITYTAFRGTIEVPATYYTDLGYYQGKFTPDKSGEYLINLGYEDEEVATSVITVHKSLIDLANLIAADEDGIIDLDDDYAYIAEFDESIIDGIVIDKAVTINGAENANIINGSDLARLFKVTDGGALTLNGVTIANAKADKGAGVYVESGATLNANNVNFTENVAKYRGGAIYSEGTVNVDTAVFDKNDITFRAANDDNGGAAIYNLNGILNVDHANITNSVKDIVIRNGNAGDLLDGVVITTGETLIQNSYFANNTGSWGGAISSLGYMNNQPYTLTVKNTTFEGNNATFGGAIYVESSNLVVEDSRFNNNLGVGVGSSGTSNTQGGAIVVHPAGSSVTITGSNFTANSANIGGAVSLAGVDKDSLIEDCIFTDNTASSEGGALYLWTQGDAVVTIKDSKFSGNTADWGNAISNDGTLSLSGNTISTTSADIANFYGSIVSPITIKILGNGTDDGTGIVPADLGDIVTISSVMTDDNGNLINDITFEYVVTNGENVETVRALYNSQTNQNEGLYLIRNAGDHFVSIESYADTDLIIYTGLYQVEKAQATLIITVENIKKGEEAQVEVELLGIEDTGLKGQNIIVRVNDVDYNIVTGANGKYSFTIPDLEAGEYEAVAVFAGNNNYELAFDSTIFYVKEEPALTVSVEDIAYGEDAIVEVSLKVGDEGINGFVDVTIGEETYNVAVIDGEGTLELPGLAVGTYTYTATFAETDDYFAAGPTDEQTFTVSIADVVTDFHHKKTGSGEEGVLFGGIANVLRDEEGNIVYDEDGNPVPDDESYVDTEFTLIFTDEDGVEVLKLEGLSPEDGAIGLPGTENLPIGKYTVTVVLDDNNYNLLADTFEFEVTPKYAQAGVDLGAIDITDGETTTVYITVGDGKVYAFTSYGDDDDEGPVYSTGTVLVLEEGDEWTKVVVLTNDADPSYVGREFYVESDSAFWHMKELFLDEGETGTGIYVRTHESGVVPQDIDGTATITITDGDGNLVQVIENVPITDGKGEYELPVLPIGEYFFEVAVDADGYDIEPAEFYDCLVVWVKEGTYTHLQQIINEGINDEDRYNDEDNSVWIDLDMDFAFDEAYDIAHNPDFYNGVVIDSDKLVKINGNGKTISGSDLARIFYITPGTQVELMNVVLSNGAVTDNGAAIYNLGELYVHDATFQDNKVTKGTVWGPGAIAAGGAAIFSYTGSSLRVENSEFLNNEAVHGTWNSFTCGAIYVSGAEKVVIADSKFENNAAVLGGAITIEDYTVDEASTNNDDYEATIHNCDFNNNLAWQGGAININEKVPYLDIDNCNFNENKAVDPNSGSSTPCGGAICAGTSNYGTKLGLYNCNFEDNSAVSAGGAIILMNEVCELGMNECNFNDNTATAGGAIYFYGESAEIRNSYFNGNDPEYGGALYIANGDVSIEDTNFDENTANYGGAIYVAKGASLDISNCEFYKNTADYGAAIYANYSSSLSISDSGFDENVATGAYGAVFLGSDNAVVDNTHFNNNKGGNGAAIFWTGDNGKLTNSNFYQNEATEGYSGGAIFAFGDNLEIDNCDFNENTAAVHGGAIAWINQGAIGGHEGTVTNSRFNNNKAGDSGGAIYWASESGTIDNCEFYNNEATVNGAAIISTGSDMTIKDSRFDNNKASTDGAIYFAGNDADLIGDSFTNGQATMGAIVLDSASISVDKSFFEGNNGMPVHYNILNSGTIESITDTTFRFINPTIELDNSYTLGDEIKMTGTFDWGVQQPAITMKYTINGEEKTTTVINAEFTADLGDLAVGTYTVVIKSFTDDNGNYYVLNTAEHTFVVEKATPVLEVEGVEDLMPGDTATVGITLTNADGDGIEGLVIVTVDGKKYVVETDANGEGSVDISGLANAKYPITAEFIGNDNYGTVTNDTEFIDFYYRDATFDIVIDDVTYGDVITIIVENATDADGNPLNGIVFGNIEGAKGDGAGLAVLVEDGEGTATVRKLNVDEYNVVATFTDETYELISETKEFTFNVDKAQSTVDVTYADGQFTITLDGISGEKLNESVAVLIDSVAYDAQTTVNGTITFAAPDLAVGQHTIEVAFDGNDNYLGDVDSFTFDIPKATPVLEVEGDDYLMPGDTATVGITLTNADGDGIEGLVIVTVDGKKYVVETDANGEGSVDISGLANAKYPITAEFIGNDNYGTVTNDTEFIDFYYRDATFDIVIDDVTYGDVITIIVENATDADGNPLNGIVFGNIEGAKGDGAGLAVLVEDGEGTATVRKLNVDEYNVVATFTDETYELISETKEFTFNVDKAQSTVDVTYADGQFTITLDGISGEKLNESVAVLIDSVAYDAQTTENGTVTFTEADLAAGRHTIEVTFAGNDNYLGDDASYSFEAPKATPVMEVSGEGVDYGQPATVEVSVKDANGNPVTGYVAVTVGDETKFVKLADNGTAEATFALEGLVPGEYPVTAEFLGNDKFEALTNTDGLVIIGESTDAVMTIAVTNVTYGEESEITITLFDGAGTGLTKDVTVTIGTETVIVNVADGEGTGSIKLGADDYTAVASFTDDLYGEVEASAEFNVAQAESAIGVSFADGEITITLDGINGEKLNETVTVAIDGTPVNLAAATENGTFTFTPDAATGKHLIEVEFAGNDNYLGDSAYTIFEVPKGTPTITVTGDEIDVGDDATVTVTVKDGQTPVAGNAVVTVNGVEYAVTIGDNGKGTVDISGLAYGEYPITAKFLGNDDYEAVDYTGTAKVVVDSDDISFDIVIKNITYGEILEVIVENATDAAGNPLAGIIMGNIENATGQGAGLIVYLNASGEGSRNYTGLTAGDYEVTATYVSDDWSMFSDTIRFTINVAQAEPLVDVAYADGEFTITLDGVNGEKLNETVTIAIDGTPTGISAATQNGTFKFSTPLDAGKHLIEVEFAGNHDYLAGSDALLFEVPKGTPTITVSGDEIDVGDDATVTVTVKDGETPVAGNAVVTVNGVDYAVTIGDNGKGTVDISGLAYGEYPIAAKFLGNDNYEAADYTGTAKVVVDSDELTFDASINDNNTIVTVSNAKDAAGETIDGYIMGVLLKDGQKVDDLTTATLSDGTGTIAIPADLAPGEYTAMISVMDSEGSSATENVTFTVEPKSGVQVTADIDDYAYGSEGELKITVTDADGNKLSGVVSIEIDGEILTPALTVTGGEVNVTVTGYDVGQHNVEVIFSNESYLPAEAPTAHFNVTKASPVVSVTGAEAEYGTPATVTVTVSGNGLPLDGRVIVTVDWIVDGLTEVIDLEEGSGEATFLLSPYVGEGNYTITATYLGNENFKEAVNNTEKVVITPSTIITMELTEPSDVPEYGEDVIIGVAVTDEAGNPIEIDAVNVTIGDETKEYSVDKDGNVNLGALPAGETEISVSYEDDFHTPCGEDLTITVKPSDDANMDMTIAPEELSYGDVPVATINVTDADGNAIEGKVCLTIDGDLVDYADLKDGIAQFEIKDLKVGDHEVVISLMNDNYTDDTFASETITVAKASPVVSVTGATVEYGNPATVKVTVSGDGLPLDGKVIITVDWIVDGLTEVADLYEGSAEAAFDLSPYVKDGEYTITATYLGNENFKEAVNATEKVIVTPSTVATVEIAGPAETPAFGDDVVIEVSVKDGSGAQIDVDKVNVTVGGETKEYPVDKDGKINLGKLPAGENEITVAFNDGVHTPANETITVPVTSGDATITIEEVETAPSEDAKVKVTVTDTKTGEPLSGRVYVNVDDEPLNPLGIALDENGTAEIAIPNLDAGKHFIEVNYPNSDYEQATSSFIIDVAKGTPVVKVTGDTVEYGNPATVKVTVSGDGLPLDGKVIVTVDWIVDGLTKVVDLKEGSGEAAFNLSPYVKDGEYTITATYLGNENFGEAVNDTEKVIITPATEVEMDVTVEAGDYGEATNVTVSLKDIAGTPLENATVTVLVDGKEYANATIGEDGTVTVPVEGLDAGDHNISVAFDDGVHKPASEEASATVEPSSDAVVDATVNVGKDGENSTVDVSVKDPENKPLTGDVTVVVDGKPYANATLDENGSANVPIGELAPGEHTVEVVFDNPNYKPSSNTSQVSVPIPETNITETNITVKLDKDSIVYGDGAITATISLTADDKAIDGKVEVLLNGAPQNVTVSGGKATVKFSDLAGGNYTVVANYAGSDTYTAASDSASFDVERKGTKFNFENMKTTAVNPHVDGRIGEYFYFQLVDEDGKPVAGKRVSIGFNGAMYNRTTNETGWAKLQINLRMVNLYTFAIAFLGDENYTGDFKVALINVTAQTPTLTVANKAYKASAKTKTLTATVKTSSGNVDSGRKVTFTVNGKSYSATTNAKGVATVKVSLTKKGTYGFTVKTAEDGTYASVSKSAKLVIT